MADMEDIVELLLKRMDSHPEEFADDYSDSPSPVRDKWGTLRYHLFERKSWMYAQDKSMIPTSHNGYPMLKPIPWLSDEQVKRLLDKLDQLNTDAFRNYVVGGMLDARTTPDRDTSLPTTIGRAYTGR